MFNRKRLALFGLLLGIIVFLGLLFAPFVTANIIAPLTLFFWLLLRMFVLSVDQQYFWWLFIAVGFLWMARHFFRAPAEAEERPAAVVNDAMRSIENWRYIIHVSATYPDLSRGLKGELRQMLINLYSSRSGNVAYSDVFEPMQKREIPLPEPVYAFLFEPEPKEVSLTFREKLRAFPRKPVLWLRKIQRGWTGQDIAEYNQSIEEVLNFMETMLEAPHDNKIQ